MQNTEPDVTRDARLSCEDYLEDLALSLRLPADTDVRLGCNAPQSSASTQLTKPREKPKPDVTSAPGWSSSVR